MPDSALPKALLAALAVTGLCACTSSSSSPGLKEKPNKATTRDAIAQIDIEGVGSGAEAMAGGRTATTFSGVTLDALQADNSELSLTIGSVTWRGQSVSVNLCADGPACQEIELAAQGNPAGFCWYTRSVAGPPNGQGYRLHPSDGWTPNRRSCSAGKEGHPTEPSSGWTGYLPNPTDCPSNGFYPPPLLCREDS